jgi:hypothetical protein
MSFVHWFYFKSSVLKELAEYEKNVNKQIYKFYAYRKVAQELLNHPVKIKTIEQARTLVYSRSL